MTARIVVGLFESLGLARDACNRLHTEGVPEGDCAHMVLHEIDVITSTAEPGSAALSVDRLIWGNVRETFARFISNGETAVLVRAETEVAVEFAADVLRLFAPIAIEVLALEPAASSSDRR